MSEPGELAERVLFSKEELKQDSLERPFVEEVVLRIHLGATYVYTGSGKASGLHYRPFAIATDVRDHSEAVVYRGLDGFDRGQFWSCTLIDWSLRFALAPKEEAAV